MLQRRLQERSPTGDEGIRMKEFRRTLHLMATRWSISTCQRRRRNGIARAAASSDSFLNVFSHLCMSALM